MPNIYVFWAGSGDPPSPWTKIATYDGRWVRCDSTAANALATGGASTHTHTVSSSSTSTTTSSINSGSGYSVIVNHTHTVSVSSIGTANNEPPYYTLALIRMDLATWQSSPTFPVGVVVASYAAIDTATYTDFEQFTAANGYYIKLGTPGSIGGSSTHVHTLSGSLASAGSSINSTSSGSASSARGGAHTHTFSGNSASATSLPKNITTRFYRVKNQAAVIPVNIVCFFDGDPTSIFTKITAWDGAILGAANTNPTVSGSYTHTHSNSSIISSAVGRTWSTGSGSNVVVPGAHRHVVAVALSSANHYPLYVNLIPAYLNTQQPSWQTRTQTYPADVLLGKTVSATSAHDVVTKKTFSTSAVFDELIKKSISSTYVADELILATKSSTYPADLLASKTYTKTFSINNQIKRSFDKPVSFDELILASKNATYSGDELVLKTLSFQYSGDLYVDRRFDYQYNLITSLTRRLDSSYAHRTSVARRNTYGAALDLLLNRIIETSYNPDVVLSKSFDIDAFLDILLNKKDIDSLYNQDVLIEGAIDRQYNIDSLLRNTYTSQYDLDVVFQRIGDVSYLSTTRIWTRPPVAFSGDWLHVLVGDLQLKMRLRQAYEAGLQVVLRNDLNYVADLFIERYDIDQDIDIGLVVSNSFTVFYNILSTLKLIQQTEQNIDALIERLDIEITHDLRALVSKEFLLETTYDVLINKAVDASYYASSLIALIDLNSYLAMDMLLQHMFDVTYTASVDIQKEFEDMLYVYSTLKRIQDIDYSVSALIERLDIDTSVRSDARVSKEFGCSADIDLYLSRGFSRDFELGMYLERLDIDLDTRLDMLLEKGFLVPYTINNLLSCSFVASLQSLATFQKEFSSVLSSAVRIWTRPPLSISGETLRVSAGDMYLRQILRQAYDVSASLAIWLHLDYVCYMLLERYDIDLSYDGKLLLQRMFLSEFELNVALQQEMSVDTVFDLLAVKEFYALYSEDVLISKEFVCSSVLNAIIQAEFDCAADIQFTLKRIQHVAHHLSTLINRLDILQDYSADVVLLCEFDISSYLDGLLLKEVGADSQIAVTIMLRDLEVAHLLSMLLSAEFSCSYDSDMILQAEFDAAVDAGITVKRIQEIEYRIGQLLNRLDIDSEYALNLEVLKTFVVDSDLSTTLQMERTSMHDAITTLALLGLEASLHVDTILQREFSVYHEMDGIFQKAFDHVSSTYATIKRIQDLMVDIGVIVERLGIDVEGELHAYVQKEFGTDYSAYGYLLKEFSQIYLMGLIAERYDIDTDYAINSLLLKDLPASYSINHALKIIGDLDYALSGVMEKSVDSVAWVGSRIWTRPPLSISGEMLRVSAGDMYVELLLRVMYGADWRLVHRRSIDHVADVIINRFDIDSEVRLASYIQKEYAFDYDINLLMQRAYDDDLSVDALVNRMDIDISHYIDLLAEKLFDTGYDIHASVQREFIIDYGVVNLISKVFSSDYLISAAIERLDIDASYSGRLAAQTCFGHEYDADMLMSREFALDSPVSAAVKGIFDALGSLDMLLFRQDITAGIDADVLMEVALSRTYDFGHILMKSFYSSYLQSMLAERQAIEAGYYGNAVVQSSFDVCHDMDTLIQAELGCLVNSYLTVKQIYNQSYVIDLLVKRLNIDLDIGADMILLRSYEAMHQSNVLMIGSLDITYILKSLINKINISIYYDSDLALKCIRSIVYGHDLNVQNTFDNIISIVISMKAVQDTLLHIVALLERLGISVDYDSDLLMIKGIPADFDFDVLIEGMRLYDIDTNTKIKRIQDMIYITDMFLERLNIYVDYILNALLIKGLDIGYEADAYVSKDMLREFDIDALVEIRERDAEFDTDTLLLKCLDIFGLMKTVIKSISDITYNVDVYINKEFMTEYLSDSVIKFISDRSITSDGLLQTLFDIDNRVDMIVKKIQEIAIGSDALIQASYEADFVGDTVIQRGFDVKYLQHLAVKCIKDIYSDLCTTIKVIQERVSDLNVLIMRMFECGSEHDMLLRRDSIDVDYDFISCIKRIQSYPYIGASTLEKALSTLYMCGGLFDKTVFSEYDNSVLLMMPGIYTNLVSDCIAARIFDYNYLNRARIKKFSIYVKGSSDARRKVISQHTPIGLVVDMKSSMKKSDTSSRVGMFVQNDSNIVLQNDV